MPFLLPNQQYQSTEGHNQLVEIQRWTMLHSTGRLVSKFARYVSGWKRLEHYGCSCLCQPRAADTDSSRSEVSRV